MLLRALGLLALAACGGTAGPTTDAVIHDACSPLALVTTATDRQASLEAAQAMWRDHGAPSLGLRADTTLEVRFDAAAGAFHGLYEDGVIYINDDLVEPELSIVVAHELGHAFGLVHITDRASVMNPANLTVPPNDADRNAIVTLWGTCD